MFAMRLDKPLEGMLSYSLSCAIDSWPYEAWFSRWTWLTSQCYCLMGEAEGVIELYARRGVGIRTALVAEEALR